MRKAVVAVLALLAVFGMLAPPSFAQAPAPKVTINGLVDFVGSVYNNWPGLDVTDGGRDRGAYTRERGVFTLTGEVGRAKGVWAVELDFTNGAGLNNGGNPLGSLNGTAMAGTTANFDLDTDVAGAVETKWLYLEVPVTGPGSMIPFIPVTTLGRFGGQPFTGHDYKFGILASGDFPGITLTTTWAPNLRSTLTYVQIAEALDKVAAPGQSDSYAVLLSVEMDLFKGFTIKPTFAHAYYGRGNCGTNNLGTEAKNGFNPNQGCGTNLVETTLATAGTTTIVQSNTGGSGVIFSGPVPTASPLSQERNYFGLDAKWTAGPFSFQPTFIYEIGNQEIPTVVRGGKVRNSVDIHAWIADAIVGFRTGPLNIEARGMWTPGMSAQNLVANGSDIHYYQTINPGFAYMAGWTELQTSGIDYATALLAGAPGLSLRQSPSYDKYGRRFIAVAADYSLTPALTLRALANASWTDEKVDTNGVVAATGIGPSTVGGGRGDARYLGTEFNAGFTYRFAPNVAFDVIGAYMFTGSAMDHARAVNGHVFGADDVWRASARARLTF